MRNFFFFLEVSNGNQLSSLSQSLLLVFWSYPLGHQCRVYIRQRCSSSSCWAPAAGQKKEKEKWLMRSYISTFLRLSRLPILFFCLSHHRIRRSLISLPSSLFFKWMNGGLMYWSVPWVFDFLLTPFRIIFLRYVVLCWTSLIAAHIYKGPTGVLIYRRREGGAGSKSSMRTSSYICCAIL